MEEISLANIYDLRPLLLENLVGITESVRKELIHHRIDDFLPLSSLLIIPIDDDDFKKTTFRYPDILDLDLADQELWYLGTTRQHSEYLILTDDGELFSECYISNIPALRLPDFILMLVQKSKLKKNIAAQCLKYFATQKRYSKKDMVYWGQLLQEIK